MLQASIQNIPSVSDICCKCFYLDVAYVAVAIHICCKSMLQMFHLFQTYVAANAFILQVFHEQAREVGAAEVVSSGTAVPTHMGSEAGMVAPTCMRSRRMCTAAAVCGDNSSSA